MSRSGAPWSSILTVAIPASLMINLGAELWIKIIFGPAYAPAAPALRVLASMFVLTYVAIVYAISLWMLERAWTLTKISFFGLAVNILLNAALIRVSIRTFGPGGGGTGCALAMLATEIAVTACMMAVVGRRAFDRRSVLTIAKSTAACAVVALADRALVSIGPIRFVVDAFVYLVIVLSTGALRLGEMIAVIRQAIRSRDPEP